MLKLKMQPLQTLPPNARALSALTTSGKVSQSSTELEANQGFDIDVFQFSAVVHQSVRLRFYYPSTHPRLTKTPLPAAGKHVVVQGYIQRVENDRCVVSVNDIELGPSDSIFSADPPPPAKLLHFDWSTKGKGKRARYDDDDLGEKGPSASSSQTAE